MKQWTSILLWALCQSVHTTTGEPCEVLSVSSLNMNVKAEQLSWPLQCQQQLFKPLPLSAAPPILFPIIIH